MLALAAAHPIIHWRSLWLIVAAFVAGVLNAIAGGGSFLSFPALLGTGIQPVQANATNTVALWPGQISSIAAYWDDVRKNMRLVYPMSLAGLIGGTIGAIVLLHTPQTTFMRLVPWLLLIAATIFALSRPITRWLDRLATARHERAGTQPQPPHRRLVFLCTVIVCFYIGYFGAGAGFLIITLLSVFGIEDLHEINALKVVSTSMANGVAFLIFVVSGNVEWRYCLMAMVACAIGGYTSARFARLIPQPVLRWIVIVIGFGMAAWFFWKTHHV
jgi:uncharacterized membrane protein YfcA